MSGEDSLKDSGVRNGRVMIRGRSSAMPGLIFTTSNDRNGNRAKGTVGGSRLYPTTTIYIGNHFEWTSNWKTKYYYHGSQRLPLRQRAVLTAGRAWRLRLRKHGLDPSAGQLHNLVMPDCIVYRLTLRKIQTSSCR